jgi:DNA-binding transcriptional LysR family regulator
VHATDYVLTILGVERSTASSGEEAPKVCVRFVPNTSDDPRCSATDPDLAVGIYGELPQEMRNRQLFTDRFVCVVRRGTPP